MTEEKKGYGLDSKALLKKHGKAGTKIKYTDRVKCEILIDTKYYKKGQIIEPHRVLAEQLIEDKVGKAIK